MAKYINVVFNLPLNMEFTYSVPDRMDVEPGYRVAASLGKRKLVGYVIHTVRQIPQGVKLIKDIERVVDKRPVLNDNILKLAEWLSNMYLCSFGEALSAIIPGGKRETKSEVFAPEDQRIQDYNLSEQQTNAIKRIISKGEGVFYLYGVAGSGKTEVFFHVAKEMIRKGKGVIYLVPEISLTHQVVEFFSSAFSSNLAVLHSGLTPSQRLKEWLRILDGSANLVIGARSAVFAPISNLGLIVIDEEHEGTYKSSTAPRYHARQVAMHRCKEENAVLIMGSATPSVEAYHYMEQGRLERLHLPVRLSGGVMPEIEIKDMKGEVGPLSRDLITEIRKAFSEGRQIILFLNRRGFAKFFFCMSCGYSMKCRNCSVSLTFHKKRNRLICHYCGYKAKPIDVCPECGSLDVGYSSFGTERIEEEVAHIFPDMRVERIDTDAVKKKDILRRILSDFRKGAIDILLGTQMVAKGLNFPGVKLVGIVSADTGLQLPDFRAAERIFSLITQVSGRAGRYHPDGKVLIQTYMPANETIRLAAQGDLETFYRKEIEARKALDFPPFSRLVRFVFRARSAKKANTCAGLFLQAIFKENNLKDTYDVLGPAECPFSVIAGNYRIHIIFRTHQFSLFHNLIRKTLSQFKPMYGVYIEVDVDPVSLL